MQKLRMVVVAAMVGAMALTTACSGSPAEQDGAQDTFSYRLPDRFKAWLDDLKWLPELEQQTGVDVEVVDGGPAEQYYQQLDLALASGDVEDVVIATSPQVEVYGPQGAFVDLAPLLPEFAPNLQAYLDETPELKQLVTTGDGAIYGLPTESPRISEVTMYRSDMFADAGIDTVPGDIEEFTEVLRELKSFYGADDPDYYPFTGRDSFIRFLWAFDAQFQVVDGQVRGVQGPSQAAVSKVDLESEGYRELFVWLNELYEEGLIDPEWVAGANSEESWQTKMLTGKASVSHDFFTRPSWFLNNGGPENDPDYDLEVMPAFRKADGEQAMVPANPRWDLQRMFAVNAQSDHAEAALRFLDHLYTPEGQLTMHYGVEGTSYEMVDGQPTYTVPFEEESNRPVGTPAWNFLQDRLTFPAPVDNDAYYSWVDEKTRSFAGDYFSTYLIDTPIIKYTPEQQQQRADVLAALEPAMEAELTSFTTGRRDLATWDDFVSETNAAGFAELHEMDQQAWDAMGG